jgi:hypothetical protein
MPTDRETLKDFQISQLGGYAGQQGLSDADATVRHSHRRLYQVLVADAATAGTAVTETVLCTVPRASRVKVVQVATPIAVTSNDTNYATFNLAKRTAGGGSTAIATQTTRTSGSGGLGNLTAFAPNNLTITLAAVDLAAGDSLTVAIPKTGSGVALTAATSYVNFLVDLEEI